MVLRIEVDLSLRCDQGGLQKLASPHTLRLSSEIGLRARPPLKIAPRRFGGIPCAKNLMVLAGRRHALVSVPLEFVTSSAGGEADAVQNRKTLCYTYSAHGSVVLYKVSVCQDHYRRFFGCGSCNARSLGSLSARFIKLC